MNSIGESCAVKALNQFTERFEIIKTDVADGSPIFYNGEPKVEINLSTAFTWMIQAAGKCAYYASDLLVDIDAIRREVKSAGKCIWNGEEYERKIGYIAMRDMGVDGVTFIAARINPQGGWVFDEEKFRKYYSALFRVTVEVVEMYGEQRVQVTTEQLGL